MSDSLMYFTIYYANPNEACLQGWTNVPAESFLDHITTIHQEGWELVKVVSRNQLVADTCELNLPIICLEEA